jgi:hypothetical protein
MERNAQFAEVANNQQWRSPRFQVFAAGGTSVPGFASLGFASRLSSVAQYGQNLSVSDTSRWHFGHAGCRLYLQFGQKLKRALTVVEHCGHLYGKGSRTSK